MRSGLVGVRKRCLLFTLHLLLLVQQFRLISFRRRYRCLQRRHLFNAALDQKNADSSVGTSIFRAGACVLQARTETRPVSSNNYSTTHGGSFGGLSGQATALCSLYYVYLVRVQSPQVYAKF